VTTHGPPAAANANDPDRERATPRERRRRVRFRSVVAWIVFHRFHLLIAAAFVGFPVVARGFASALFSNLFVLSWQGQVAVDALAIALGHVLAITVWASTRNGPIRLWPGIGPRAGEPGAEPAPDAAIRFGYREFRNAFRRSWGTSRRAVRRIGKLEPWIALALALPTVVAVAVASAESPFVGGGSQSLVSRLLAIAVAVGVVGIGRAAAALVTAWLSPFDLRHGLVAGSWVARRLVKIAAKNPPRLALWLRDRLVALLARPPFGPGYVWVDPRGRRFLHSGHLAALGFLTATSLVYAVQGLADAPGSGEPWLPALGDLLLVLIVVAWVLPGISFLLDRFRVPVLPALLVFSLALYSVAGRDHFFALRESSAEAPVPGAGADDTATIDAWFESAADGSPAPPIVAVAAAGGGITSAAWTAETLAGLASEPTGGAFLRSLRLVSAVSGGSVGAMFFLDALPAGTPLARAEALSPAAADSIRTRAAATSLASVGWGLAYPDLLRMLSSFPFATFWPQVDRSWALEESWRGRLTHPEPAPTLGEWRQATLAGEMPLVVFNATAVETGDRVALATLALGPLGARSFWRTYEGWDVAVPAAVRLSATFPFVSLAARARLPATATRADRAGLSKAHYVDGGYTDNSGLLSVLEVLDAALERRCGPAVPAEDAAPCSAPSIFVVRLRPFDETARDLAKVSNGHPWLTSALSPLETLMAVREAGPAQRNAFELDLFLACWRRRGVEIETVDLPLGERMPLSWKLTAAERRTLTKSWQELSSQPSEELCRLRRALGAPECA